MPAKKAAKNATAEGAEQNPPKKAAVKKAGAKPAADAIEKPSKTKPSVPAEKPTKKPAAPQGSAPTQNRTRVKIAMAIYEPQKDAIKAPFKQQGLKWNFLGEGKGLYKHPDGGIHCFTQFKDDGVHYSIWGANDAGVQEILAAWRALLGPEGWAQATAGGEQAEAQEQAAKESEAVRAWKLQQPQPRPGEPEFFLKKRLAEWEAKKPR